MPPASPVPGWSRGDVCTERVATRRGRDSRYADPTLVPRSGHGASVNRVNLTVSPDLPDADLIYASHLPTFVMHISHAGSAGNTASSHRHSSHAAKGPATDQGPPHLVRLA